VLWNTFDPAESKIRKFICTGDCFIKLNFVLFKYISEVHVVLCTVIDGLGQTTMLLISVGSKPMLQ